MTNEELAGAIQAGQNDLIETLWAQCYKYIKYQAGRWERAWQSRTDFDIDDLIQQGYFAICAAVNGWSEEKGHSFISYLDLCLKTEFAKVAGCRTTAQMEDPIYKAVRLESPAYSEEDGLKIGETMGAECEALIAFEEKEYRESLAKAVREAVAALPDQKRKAIEAHYFQGKPFAMVAEEMSISTSRAARIANDGLRMIRTKPEGADLREMLFESRSPYRGTGFQAWKGSGMSAPEREVIYREKMRNRYDLSNRTGKLLYCVEELGIPREQAERMFPA